MIRPPGRDGVAFSDRADGDLRDDASARRDLASRLRIPAEWACVRQVHGNEVIRVGRAGQAGRGDGIWTTEPALPLAVFTADCFGVVLHSDDAVGVAHAGWRGAAAGVVGRLRDEMVAAGHRPERAAIGPGIGPCCFEVGPEVAVEFPGNVTSTTWETTSVDLRSAIVEQLEGIDVWASGHCTLHEDLWLSHRGNGTEERMATLGWLP